MQRALEMAGVMIGELARLEAGLEVQSAFLHELVRERGEVHNLRRELACRGQVFRASDRFQVGNEVLFERDGAGRARGDHVLHIFFKQRLDVVGTVLRGHFVGSAVARGSAATGLALREGDLDAGLVQHSDHCFTHLGIREVHQAAAEERSFLRALRLLDLLDAVAERLVGDGGQRAVLRHAAEEHRQMADETIFCKRLLPDRRGAHHRVEESPIVDHRKDCLLDHRLPLLHGEAAAQFENQVGDIDLSRTDVLAASALDAEALDLIGFLQRVKPSGENRTDATGINLAEDMSAYQAEDRANVEARSAADALQRLLEARIVRHLIAAVVHQNDVQFLGRAVCVGHRAADDGDIAGQQLRGGAPGQRGEDRRDVLESARSVFRSPTMAT